MSSNLNDDNNKNENNSYFTEQKNNLGKNNQKQLSIENNLKNKDTNLKRNLNINKNNFQKLNGKESILRGSSNVFWKSRNI